MKKLLFISFIFVGLLSSFSVIEAKAETVYGYAVMIINTDSRTIDGYSATWLDFSAGLYYDPEVRGDLYRDDDIETSLDSGWDVGYSSLIPAEVFLNTDNYVEDKIYCVFSQHWIRPVYHISEPNLHFDPFNFESLNRSEGGVWEGSAFSYNNILPDRIFMGWTQVCGIIPNSPTPTPTPTPPPPTPTPTPCNSNLGNCQESATFRIHPTAIRPKSVSGRNETATAKVCIYPAQANKQVTLKLVLRTEFKNSGGHVARHHSGSRPLGKLAKTSGRTGSDGCFSTKYHPSHISGTIGIDATLENHSGSRNLFVGVDSLLALVHQAPYNLIGERLHHPINHYGTVGTVRGLGLIAQDYNNEYYNGGIPPTAQKIAFNDMSLEFGGKFELVPNWLNSGHHGEHREGINCDVRSRNIDLERRRRLKQIFINRGSTQTLDETHTDMPHWHLRFVSSLLTNDSSSQVLNGIEQNPNSSTEVNSVEITPHSFVEDAWEVLDRSSTQEEWEVWHDRLIQAKAQGSSQLLTEIKAFEISLFSMSEYVARQRTDEEFIEDIFWSHFFRQPTQAESVYWQNYLDNLPPSLPESRQRRRLIDEFENLPDFEEVVNSIVDSSDPPPIPTPTP